MPRGILASAVPLQVSISPIPGMLLAAAAILLVFGLVVLIWRYRETPRRDTLIAIVAVTLGIAAIGGAAGYGAYRSYVDQNTWSYSYSLVLQGNATSPESLVVPAAADEGLLSGLHLASGTANWSLVDTQHGRGLFVRFTHSATLAATVSTFPRPATLPDTRPTMTSSGNCTAQPSNCTGWPSVWIYYGGSAGGYLALSIGSFDIHGYLTAGWALYAAWPHPVVQY